MEVKKGQQNKEQALLLVAAYAGNTIPKSSIKVYITQHLITYWDEHSAVFSQVDTLKESKVTGMKAVKPPPSHKHPRQHFFTVNHILYTGRRDESNCIAHVLILCMQHLPVR